VDVSAVQPLGLPSLYRQMLGLAEGQVVALFSGTLGAKQGLHLIAEAARLLVQRCPQVMFVPQDPGVADLVMPSKLTAMLSSGRAVLSSAKPPSQ
jgi:colanic acid biosynthesis glycosyl transferase WcaI